MSFLEKISTGGKERIANWTADHAAQQAYSDRQISNFLLWMAEITGASNKATTFRQCHFGEEKTIQYESGNRMGFLGLDEQGHLVVIDQRKPTEKFLIKKPESGWTDITESFGR